MYILGIVDRDMPADTLYTIRVGGVENPRFVVTDAETHVAHHWRIRTYDSDYPPAPDPLNAQADANHLIDEGRGGYINIDVVSPVVSFNAEAFDTTNGVSTKYYFSWFSDIPTKSGDFIYIAMPPELAMVPTGGDTLLCKGANGLGTGASAVTCRKQGNMLKVVLNEVTQSSGLYKITAENIRNAPSLRRSGAFPAMYHAALPDGPGSTEAKVAEFRGKSYVVNEFAADLQGLGWRNIVQSTTEYGAEAEFKITFTPHSTVKLNPAAILLAYPVGVEPAAEALDPAGGCTVTADEAQGGPVTTPKGNCEKIAGARLFKIKTAIPKGYGGPVTIALKMRNPADNWGAIGFKLKTYEEVTTPGENGAPDSIEEFLVDMLEGNELLPALPCEPPCQYCRASVDGLTGSETHANKVKKKEYCTQCW
jgi:hypothetical protein